MSGDLSSVDAGLQLRSLRLVIGALATGPIMVGLAAMIVLPPADPTVTGLLLCLAIGAAGGVVAYGMQATLARPVPQDSARPVADGMSRLQALSITQATLCAGSGAVLFGLAFVFEFSPTSVLLGLVVAGVAVLVVTWPTAGRLRRVTAQLERAGARVGLDQLSR